jgi:acetoacetyl-CoA synthetase
VVIGDPTNPFYAGEIQTEALGMAIDILDTGEEQPVSIKQSGQPGELVCRAPFPSQPVGFWGDADMVKYGSTYYERFGPRVWYQGDFVSVVPSTGGYIMLGRS